VTEELWQAPLACSNYYDLLEDFSIVYETNSNYTYSNLTSGQYLMNTDGGQCRSMITEVPDEYEASIVLGAPWFRSVIVSLDYETNMIEVFALNS